MKGSVAVLAYWFFSKVLNRSTLKYVFNCPWQSQLFHSLTFCLDLGPDSQLSLPSELALTPYPLSYSDHVIKTTLKDTFDYENWDATHDIKSTGKTASNFCMDKN